MDEVSIDIDAPAEVLYDLVADVTQMGRWSPECERCEWLGDATGPRVGARFKGWNRAAFGAIPVRWSTVSTVRRADRGRAFAFDTKQSRTRWTYRFDPIEAGTRVTESRESIGENVRNKVLNRIVPQRLDALRDGMADTLQRLKAGAEAAQANGTATASGVDT